MLVCIHNLSQLFYHGLGWTRRGLERDLWEQGATLFQVIAEEDSCRTSIFIFDIFLHFWAIIFSIKGLLVEFSLIPLLSQRISLRSSTCFCCESSDEIWCPIDNCTRRLLFWLSATLRVNKIFKVGLHRVRHRCISPMKLIGVTFKSYKAAIFSLANQRLPM